MKYTLTRTTNYPYDCFLWK